MPKKLRPGLIEPSDIPKEHLNHYLGDTYRGYMTSLKQRIELTYRSFNVDLGASEFNIEFIALQTRMMLELLAFALSTFHQNLTEPIGKSKRTVTDPLVILGKLKTDHPWFNSLATDIDLSKSGFANIQLVQRLKNPLDSIEYYKKTHGKLGKLLHEQQRPRPTNDGMLTLKDLRIILRHIFMLTRRHLITDEYGSGWMVDLYTQGQPNEILIMKISNAKFISSLKS
ncbi:MAG: hypothetical protein RIC80_15930 [Cyclobacteriaceae bacterium]